jgi:hypothetical protein
MFTFTLQALIGRLHPLHLLPLSPPQMLQPDQFFPPGTVITTLLLSASQVSKSTIISFNSHSLLTLGPTLTYPQSYLTLKTFTPFSPTKHTQLAVSELSALWPPYLAFSHYPCILQSSCAYLKAPHHSWHAQPSRDTAQNQWWQDWPMSLHPTVKGLSHMVGFFLCYARSCPLPSLKGEYPVFFLIFFSFTNKCFPLASPSLCHYWSLCPSWPSSSLCTSVLQPKAWGILKCQQSATLLMLYPPCIVVLRLVTLMCDLHKFRWWVLWIYKGRSLSTGDNLSKG